ncbi:MAG: glycogen/starch synthase [Bacteroidales bacterium]|jgi:starch synthase|nr:glycogen/starch synthase [Bacteroidales bacterium]MDI9591632.1 glycogen/starch synthase [Bacteroidota bacterium]OQC38570.1 MAG: Glycogen synthase [Bacteroidetes bacterium ADurb.Bin041]HNV49532.1 glycogen/starch synthase [Bacteroidales bacterium]HOF81203.1 glycogen/starch synthase [Bacteroidales bacterium]
MIPKAEKIKVLYVMQEITPYLDESPLSNIGRYLPQGTQESGKEIRTFMPKYGQVNERRNQLHEVIRLSGMNLIIDDADHPLIIKVASIQQARMQVYFIDNEDYFQRKGIFHDKNGQFFEDNDERLIFYARGVIETVRKLGWPPDIIHCHGWFSSLVPLYIKRVFKDNPLFSSSTVIYSLYDDFFEDMLNHTLVKKLKFDKIKEVDLKNYRNPDYIKISKAAIKYSDALIFGSEKINPELEELVRNTEKPLLEFLGDDNYITVYNDFYEKLLKHKRN